MDNTNDAQDCCMFQTHFRKRKSEFEEKARLKHPY